MNVDFVGLFDLAAVAGGVLCAVAFLVARFKDDKPPACHQTPAAAPPQVIVGAALARGLQRARKSEKRVNA